VPAEHQIWGLGPIVLNVPDLARTARLLTDVLNMKRARDYASPDGEHRIDVFSMGEGGLRQNCMCWNRRTCPRRGRARVACIMLLRTPNEEQYHAWTARLAEFGIHSSGEIDRFYFRSLYFREPNGILFEIATDGPGFATDEPMEKLEKLALPPFLEPRRKEIESGLKPLI
jgi:glyoxalase family protein